MVDIQSPTSENRPGKKGRRKKEEDRNHRAIARVSLATKFNMDKLRHQSENMIKKRFLSSGRNTTITTKNGRESIMLKTLKQC